MSAWWDEDHKLLLVTPDEFEQLDDGTVLTCIDDTTAVKGQDEIDDDLRFGHLAYGVTGDHPLRLAKLAENPNKPLLAEIREHKVWSCKIGVLGGLDLPPGSDAPMRQAVAKAFFELTGREAEFTFSGWGDKLDEGELNIVCEQAQPREEPTK